MKNGRIVPNGKEVNRALRTKKTNLYNVAASATVNSCVSITQAGTNYSGFFKFVASLLLMLVLCISNAWGFTSTPKFSIAKTSDTPNGAGQIYGYRGGGDATTSGGALYLEGDKLKTGITGWVAAETGMDLAEMTIKQTGGSSGDYNPSTDANNRPDGYKVLDRRQDYNGDGTVHILHMYYYAKPNPGYEYVGWYSNEAGTAEIAGSTNHYPYPQSKNQVENSGKKTFTPKTWDNGDGSSLPAKGPYSDFYYLRDAQEITKATANAAKTVYVKFRIIPRHVVFVGTGFDNVSYTAGGTNVGATNVESGDITGDIALNITYDAEKYNFNGWQWSLGPDGAKTNIASTASATYTFVVNRGYPTATYNSTTGRYDYGAYTKVYIQPLLTEKVDYVAEVTHNEVTTSYASWDEAFAAAKATGVSGAVITLKKDVADITTEQTVDRNMTLNLNGHTLTGGGTNSYLFTVSGSGTVFTLCDNTPAAAGRIVYNTSEVQYPYAIGVKTGAKLLIASGGVSATSTKSDGSSRGVEIQAGGTLEMTGGEIYSQSINSAYALLNRGTATIGGGNIRARAKGTSTAGTGKTAVAFYSVGTSGTINGGTFTATADSTTSYGIQHNVANQTLTINYAISTATAGKSGAVALQRNNGKILVKGGKYKASSVLNTTNKSYIELQGGIYSTWTNVRQSCATGYDCYELQLGADWNDGYRFEVIAATANPRVCKILEVGKSTSYYTSLSDALAYANNNTGSVMSIIMIAFEHTLPAGNYTLPSRANLVVPYSVDQTGVSTESPRMDAYSTPKQFRKLTFNSGVLLDAFGSIEVGGVQNSNGQGATGCGTPSGTFGHILLNEGSRITLENGARLNAWGFITGNGEIDARRGSSVYEQFQMYDWKGGWAASKMMGNSGKVFPVTQYFIQNIEAPTIYHPGSSLKCATAVYVNSKRVTCDDIGVIGTYGQTAMFLMDPADDSKDTWVRKEYEPSTDQQVYKINSGAQLGSMRILLDLSDLGALVTALMGDKLDFNSADYILPLTNNMKIELLTGTMDITQNTLLLPGAEIEVDKEATVSVINNQSLYVVDAEQWAAGHVFSGAMASEVRYSPTFAGKPNKRSVASKPKSASMFVHGTFEVAGKLYTTENGANIYSTNEDAGTIRLLNSAPASTTLSLYSGQSGSQQNTEISYATYNAVSALLRNGDNSTTNTSGTTAGKSFAYTDNKWECWTQEGCFYKDNKDTYYAKPADYVALLNGKTENADHTYTSADETRTFILVEGCQWWEVELEDADAGLWHCTHPLNDVYYYHNGTTWVVKTQTVTWKNYDGSVVATYSNVPYKTTPVYNSTTPTRPMDDYYTYDFKEWSPALAPITTDMVYTAQYTPKDRKYTIVFKNEDGSVIETNYCTMGQVPVCSKEPSKAGYTLVWSPTIQAVTGDAEYKATFTNVVKDKYTVTFKNYNNTEVLLSGEVETGTMPVYSGETPTKPSTTDQKFTFTGWEPALHNVDGDVVYTPVFSASAITYTIVWKIDGTEKKREDVGVGITPSYGSIPAKESDAQYDYTFAGWTPAVGPATKDQEYSGSFDATPRSYTIRFLNDDGVTVLQNVQMQYGATPSYSGTPASTMTDGKIREFKGWSPEIYDVNKAQDYIAQYSIVSELVATEENPVTIDNNTKVDVTTVKVSGKLNVSAGTLTTTDLILEASTDGSGDITGVNNITVPAAGHVYFDYTFDTDPWHWSSFGVPFEIDLAANAPLKETTQALTLGSDYDIVYYDSHERATNGANKNCWKYVEKGNKKLTPGVLYLIAFNKNVGHVNVLRFTKATGADIDYTGEVSMVKEGTGTNANWNGIANPKTYHAILAAGTQECQVHDGGEFGKDGYNTYTMKGYETDYKFFVGKAAFVQVPDEQSSITVSAATDQDAIVKKAPRRAQATVGSDRYDIMIAPLDGEMADRLFVLAEEDKADEYVIVADLAKAGVSPVRAQMWVNRYGEKLCKNTAPLVNSSADYPLGISVPQTGEYEIYVNAQPAEESVLYLTFDGKPVWNLNYGGYITTLDKGTTERYGLRFVKTASKIATGVEELTVENGENIRKVLVDDKIYIIRNGKTFTVTGQTLKY